MNNAIKNAALEHSAPANNPENKPINKQKSIIKALAFLLFVIGALLVVNFTPLKGYLKADQLEAFIDTAGLWAPALYIVLYAVGVCLFLPGTLLTGLGAAIFGAYWGFVYVWIGAMIGASGAFFIGRPLARNFPASLIGERLKRMIRP